METNGYKIRNTRGEIKASVKLGMTVAEHATEEEMDAIRLGKVKAKDVLKAINKRIQEEEKRKAEEQRKQEAKAAQSAPETKKRARWKSTDKKLSEEEQKKLLLKETGRSIAKNEWREVLSKLFRHVENGTESYVATDGRRLTVISRPTNEKDSGRRFAPDGTEYGYDGNYPNYRMVIPDDSHSDRATVQFNLMDIPSVPKGTAKLRYTYTLDFGERQVMVNSDYLQDAINQVKALGQNMGASPIVTIGYTKPGAVNRKGNPRRLSHHHRHHRLACRPRK